MPIIGYQSFNSNSSSSHGLGSASFQRFTVDTNRHVTQQGHQALVLPHNSGNLADPIEGPAHLRPIEVLSGPQPVPVFGTQISLVWQNFYRAFGGMPDIMVCGEIDTSHPDFASMISDPAITMRAMPSKKACQSFTAISQTTLASQVQHLGNGEGYCVYSVADLIVVFVHVPNRIATSLPETKDFYLNIAQSVLVGGKVIDLIIGDTNQGSFDFTASVLNTAFGTTAYMNATSGASVAKIDNYGVVERGTNSTGSKMYDVAVYRSDKVKLVNAAYISQSSGAVTITDHCGLGVKVERKGAS